MADIEREKRRAATRALEEVEDGMVLGLGSGSTAAHAIREIGNRVDGGLDVVGVPTSHQSAQLARTVGIPVRCLEDVSRIDLAIDGADQVAGHDLIKGGGAAHTREKIIDTAAERFVVVIDSSKERDVLDLPIPLEVMPDAVTFVTSQLEDAGGRPTIRATNEIHEPVLTDNGNFVVDCDFGAIDDPTAIAHDLADIPGLVDHGLFVEMADAIYIGSPQGIQVR